MLLTASHGACGDGERYATHETCFLPADMTDQRDVEGCPDAWAEETVSYAEESLAEGQMLQNIDGPEPEVVELEDAPWVTECCYTVYSAGDTSWPLL